jgi:hypothetical protein
VYGKPFEQLTVKPPDVVVAAAVLTVPKLIPTLLTVQAVPIPAVTVRVPVDVENAAAGVAEPNVMARPAAVIKLPKAILSQIANLRAIDPLSSSPETD